jgi:hypothetical protein
MRKLMLTALAALTVTLSLSAAEGQRPRTDKGDPNRLICRSTPKTGTLAGRERQCFTRAQWDEQAARQSKVGFEMQEKYRTSPCGDPSAGC